MNAMKQDSLLPEECFDQKFPLPLRERVRVRGLCEPLAPSPHSSPVKGEEVSKSANVLFSSPISPPGSRLALVVLTIFSLVFAGFARIGFRC